MLWSLIQWDLSGIIPVINHLLEINMYCEDDVLQNWLFLREYIRDTEKNIKGLQIKPNYQLHNNTFRLKYFI